MATKRHADPQTERRLEDLLGDPREDLNIELKGWLDLTKEDDRADLAKAILALANFGGGYVLLGFAEVKGTWKSIIDRPSDLKRYSQDDINGIVHRYAEPPFHCEVHHVSHPVSGEIFPVTIVPGGHTVPIRAKRDGPNRLHVRQNAYYIRRPGPMSDEPKSAKEWDDLISRCIRARKEEMLESIRTIVIGIEEVGSPDTIDKEKQNELDKWIESARNRWEDLYKEELQKIDPFRYSNGIWSVAYIITGETGMVHRVAEIG